MQPNYHVVCSEEGEEPTISAADKAWEMATVFEFNGTRIETPFAKMQRSSVKWYFLGSLILWSFIFYGCYKTWTTTVRPYLWGPYEDKPPISIDPALLEEQKHQSQGKADMATNLQQSVVRRPKGKKSEKGMIDKLLPSKTL